VDKVLSSSFRSSFLQSNICSLLNLKFLPIGFFSKSIVRVFEILTEIKERNQNGKFLLIEELKEE
jgi:hypothetical protein